MANRFSSLPMRIAADGTVTYDFDGHLHAQGLDLDLSASGTPPDADKIRWLRASDGGEGASLGAFGIPGLDQLSILATALSATDSGRVFIASQDAALAKAAALLLTAIPGGTPSEFRATADGNSVVVLDGANASAFPKLADGVADVAVDFGVVLIGAIAAGATGDVTAAHNLNRVPGFAGAIATDSRLTVAAQTYTAADATFRLRNVTAGASPGAGVFWLAIG